MSTETAVEDYAIEDLSENVVEQEVAEKPTAEVEDDDAEEDEVVVSIGEPPPPKTEEQDGDGDGDDIESRVKANAAFAKMRKEKREAEQKLAALQRQLDQQRPAPAALTLAKEPALEDDDVDYDQAKFRAKTIAWAKQKAEVDAASAQAAKAATDKLSSYMASMGKVKVGEASVSPKEAHDVVISSFSVDQQNALLQYTDASHLVVLALGNNPDEATRLANITDPVKFAVALGRLEEKIKVTSMRKPSTSPEKSPTGGRSPAATDTTRARLEKKADDSGDYTELLAYDVARDKKRK